MRILVVSQIFAPQREGGAEIVARRTAHALAECHEVAVLSLTDKSASEEWIDGLPVTRLRYSGAYLPNVAGAEGRSAARRAFWHGRNATTGVSMAELARALDRLTPDVIHAHAATAFHPQLATAARTRHIPIVQHLHDYGWLCPRATMFRKGAPCAEACRACRILTRNWRMNAYDAITDAVAVSDFVARRHRDASCFSGARWHVLPNVDDPASLAGYKPLPASTETGVTFGYIGALTRAKGVSSLLDTWTSTARKGDRLIIAGRSDPAVEARIRASRDQGVELLGHVPPNEFYSAVDAVVVPSLWHEPQALVVTEAMARGLPIAASRRGGNTEMLRNRRATILYEPDTPGALGSALDELRNVIALREKAPVDTARADRGKYISRLLSILEAAAAGAKP